MIERTVLHARHLAAGGRMVDFAGWEMPQQYTSVRDEHRAVRTTAGVFDVSHMGRFALEGRSQAIAAFLDSVVTNRVAGLPPGRALYTLLCNPRGGVVDDLIVYHDHDLGWHLVVNAANRAKDMAWLRDHAPSGVALHDRSAERALIAFQGPEAAARLPVAGIDLESMPAFGTAPARVAGVPMLIARTGYTGEDGFELFAPSASAGAVWDALLEAGGVPAGLAARDVCRLEAGLRLYGSDMDDDTDPYQAGLGWTVRLDKGEFLGGDALRRVKEAGPSRRLVGVRGRERTIPRPHAAISTTEGAPAGMVTSGTWSFWLEAGIGFASVQAGRASVGDVLLLEGRAGSAPVDVIALPFYRGSVRPAAPPQ